MVEIGSPHYELQRIQRYNCGTSATTFSPNSPCTCAIAVDYLWKAANSPYALASNQFDDVPQKHAQAVDWVVANGVTYGTSDKTFPLEKNCTRAKIITFIYRIMPDMS